MKKAKGSPWTGREKQELETTGCRSTRGAPRGRRRRWRRRAEKIQRGKGCGKMHLKRKGAFMQVGEKLRAKLMQTNNAKEVETVLKEAM